ncbi:MULTISPECIES: hypothetical protein [Haloferax]|uniref:Uncharacterized protein n=2 Tax=Haloferax TaxID=2251 RepID=A0A6G1Z590_9EURY|nr:MULTISPECIES: hypothetical protein [Haloferax]KAB1188912.1 hypothetical protein Hfx1149_13070 [Haloferax sp. CBA1149]MRW81635.1 hypothetical protein [Haloferax marinisediminis]
MSDRRRDDDILDVLDELGDTLDELGSELREERDREVRDRFRNPRPPTFGEVMRFTESYTLPTIIAVLEATIASLELLRRLIRLSDPGRVMEDRRAETEIDERLREVPRTAVYGVERALDELRKALSEADLPSNSDARDIMEHARSLADELDERITAAERERTSRDRRWRDEERSFESSWRRRNEQSRSRNSGPVRIDVTEEGIDHAGDDDASDDSPQVDVDAELESIKREVRGDDEDDEDE